MNSSSRLRIVVLGYIVRCPLGGFAWHHLQYVLGLRHLGHEVIFLEDSDDYPSCYDPSRQSLDSDPTYGLTFAENTFTRLGLAEHWAYYDAHSRSWFGPFADRAQAFCANADLCLNVSGVNPLRPWTCMIPRRALIDTDPVFTQIKHLTDDKARRRAADHTDFLTFGENLASGRASCPDDGFSWRPTRQPVFLDAWPETPTPEHARFTTVMQWESYQTLQYEGQKYGMKSASFQNFQDLPRKTPVSLEIALGSKSAPRHSLVGQGWRLRDPLEVTRDPWIYQHYICDSRGEFSVAKHGYVVTQSGWFSERSAAYLACGRPVIIQDTGFTDWLNVERGVLSFADAEQAVAQLEEVTAHYQLHARAAREVCHEYFDATRVLEQLLAATVCG